MPEWSSISAYAAIPARLVGQRADRSACSDHLAGGGPAPANTG
jgi:hypothetical protein